MGTICSLADVKSYLELDSTTHDEFLEMLINGATAQIQSYTGRVFEKVDYTELLDGTGKAVLPVDQSPIVEVKSIVNAYGYAKEAFRNSDKFIHLTDGTVFTKGKENWIVTYTGGYETVPNDVRQACIELVAYKFKDRGERIGVSSKTLAGGVVTFEKRDIRESVRNLLSSYVRVC